MRTLKTKCAAPFDLAIPPAGLDEAPARRRMLTRRQRACSLSASTWERAGVRWRDPRQAAFFNYLVPGAREILDNLLEEYASDGELQLTLPDGLKLPPNSHHGNVNEIIRKFMGAEQFRTAVNQLQTLMYVA